jgi:hypothetical protein
MKSALIFCFLFIITTCVTGQTLIGVKGGINWSYFRDAGGEEDSWGNYKCYPSYAFGVDIKGRKEKGRKSKALHIGGSVEYYRSSIDWAASYGKVETAS